MAEFIFVGIGVSRPRGMTALPGVKNSVEAMQNWAKSRGYRCLSIIDDTESPVTAARVANELQPYLENKIDRIVIYFVGHGFLNYPDQIWILSDGPDVNTGRVSRDTFRESLSTYHPKQIAIISDACLEARYFATGTVAILNDRSGPRHRVFVDGFYSTLNNLPAFAFRPAEGQAEFCLFTSVLVDFLNGDDKRAFRLASGTSQHVTTQTLYFSLPEAVLERGAFLNVNQEPRIEPGFPQGDDIYSPFPGDSHLEPPPPPPPPISGPDDILDNGGMPGVPMGRLLRDQKLSERLGTQSLGPVLDAPDKQIIQRLVTMAHDYETQLAALVHHRGQYASWGFIVNEQPTGFITGPYKDKDNGYWCPIVRADLDEAVPYVGRRPRSLLTLSWFAAATEYFVMIPVFDQLIATIQIGDSEVREDQGCTHLSWAPAYWLPGYHGYTTEAFNALNLLLKGSLANADVGFYADRLRSEKHINPMIGIICAYLYDSVGDFESVARLCHFYVQHSQGIPFDVALLSGGKLCPSEKSDGWEVSYPGTNEDLHRAHPGVPSYLWKPTPEGRGAVAGMAPMIRAGWSRLAASNSNLLRAFSELESSLSLAPISTIVGKAAIERVRVLLQELKFFSE